MQDLNDKVTGGSLTADEWNQVPSELQNIIENSGQSLSGGDLNQVGKGVAAYTAAGDAYRDNGGANALSLIALAQLQTPTQYLDQMRIRTIANATNTGATTINVAGLGVKDLVNQFNAPLAGGEIVAGTRYEFYYSLANDNVVIVVPSAAANDLPRGYINGYDTDKVSATAISILAGSAKNAANDADMLLATDLGKELTVDWVAGGTPGAPAGGFPSALTLTLDTWYRVFIISNGAGQVDAGFDTSPVAANLLADATGFTNYRQIGFAWYQSSNSQIRDFDQDGDNFIWRQKEISRVFADIPGTAPDQTELLVPPDDGIYGYFSASIQPNVNSTYAPVIVFFPTDSAPGYTIDATTADLLTQRINDESIAASAGNFKRRTVGSEVGWQGNDTRTNLGISTLGFQFRR